MPSEPSPTVIVTVARDGVLEAVGQSRQRVWLASPFLSRSVAEAIIDRAPKENAADRRFLTALTQASVEAGVLDPDALVVLAEAGWHIRSIPNLHAKAVVCDDRKALVGSANLTVRGLGGGNLELGSWLAGEQVRVVVRHLANWWVKAATVEPRHLRLAMDARRDGPRGPGWIVGAPLKIDEGAKLKATRRLRNRVSDGSWLKAMYHDRGAPPDWWVHQPWISDAHGRTRDGQVRYTRSGEPARKPTYRLGDFVILYLVGPGVLPAIYEVTAEPRFDVEFVKQHWPADAGTYGWVTDVELVLRADLGKAPKLSATGIPGRALQGGRKRLTSEEFEVIRSLIQAAS